MFQDLGSPEPWPAFFVEWAGRGMWVLLLAAIGLGVAQPAIGLARRWRATEPHVGAAAASGPNLSIPGAWVLGAVWIWHAKPETWFSSYMHFALWTFCGLALLHSWQRRQFRWLANILGLLLALLIVFVYMNVSQAVRLGSSRSWSWETFRSYVDCVGDRLAALESDPKSTRPLHVWVPTYPDITVELSRRHPGWRYTRHNDFGDRGALAVSHGRRVDAVVITEIRAEDGAHADRDGPLSRFHDLRSVWLGERGERLKTELRGYNVQLSGNEALYELDAEPGWKPDRYLCQRGRWQAFILASDALSGAPAR
jgi:hypothetical protein